MQITAVDAQVARGNNHVELGVVLTLQQRHHLTQTGVTAGQYRSRDVIAVSLRSRDAPRPERNAATRTDQRTPGTWRLSGRWMSPPVGGVRLGRTTEGGPAGAPRSPDRRDSARWTSDGPRHRDVPGSPGSGWAGGASGAAAAMVQRHATTTHPRAALPKGDGRAAR